MITFKFDLVKTLQASAVLLQHRNGKMEHIRLLKLLYIADRELLVERGKTITGDSAYAMKNGPVLSKTYELVKGTGSGAAASLWNSVVRKSGRQISIVPDAVLANGKLSKAELLKLKELSERYRDLSVDDIIDVTHKFEEWLIAFDNKKPTAAVKMKWDDALNAQDASELSPVIESNLQEQKAFHDAIRVVTC